jgi:prepilin signal peptidase PulO-like enzyme (type II secretory pathway)
VSGAARWAGIPGTATASWSVTHSAAAAAAGIGVLASLVRNGFTPRGVASSCLLGVLGALAVIDFREHVVPVRLVLPATGVLLALQLVLFPDQALEWVLASVLAFAGLAALWAVKRDGIELRDATLGLLLGAGLGSEVAVAMFFGFLAIWPAAVYLLLRDGVDARKASVPLAPAFTIGAALVVFAT